MTGWPEVRCALLLLAFGASCTPATSPADPPGLRFSDECSLYSAGETVCWPPLTIASPIAPGAHARFDVIGHGVRARVEDESVLRLEPFADPGAYVATAQAPGSARVVLEDETTGAVVAEQIITVRQVARVERVAPSPEEPYLLLLGGTDGMQMLARDDDGRAMIATGAFVYTGDGLRIERPSDGVPWFNGPEEIYVSALGLGPTSIEARSGAAVLSIDVEVVDATAIDRVSIGQGVDVLVSRSVRASAFDASGVEIHGVCCSWTVELDGAPQYWSSSCDSLAIPWDDRSGFASVTCDAGGHSHTISVPL